MLKQVIAIISISLGVILASSYAQEAVQLLLRGHEWISQLLTEVFSSGSAGDLTRQLIAVLAVPLLIGIIMAVLYWVLRRSWFPYFMPMVWLVWLVQTTAIVASRV